MTDWDAIEREIVEANRRASNSADPALTVRRLDEARKLAVREGWSDEHGNSLLPAEDEDEE